MATRTRQAWAGPVGIGAAASAGVAAPTRCTRNADLPPVGRPFVGIGGAIMDGGAPGDGARVQSVSTFWEEVRRYGVTVASYTWTMLDEAVQAPPEPGRRRHPVRLFIGSGMPRGLWRRVERRFRPARVVEFYASTEAGAILVNLRDSKLGSMGRPLPGSAELRIAQYDLDARGLVLDRDGYARGCDVDEVGMLLARVSPTESLTITPLRSLFAPDDAWVATGDLFRRDEDGDYWRVDGVGDAIRTAEEWVFSTAIRDALWDIDAVDLALAYGVRPEGGEHEIAVAAVTLRRGASLAAREVSRALSVLPEEQRPAVVHVADHIPVTTWFRPRAEAMRAVGLPEHGEGEQAWYLDASGETYRPLTAAARRRLIRAAGGGEKSTAGGERSSTGGGGEKSTAGGGEKSTGDAGPDGSNATEARSKPRAVSRPNTT